MSNTPRQRSASLRPAPSPSIPDGGRDPVRSASQLLGVAGLVAAVPAVDETIILPLDHDGIGRGIGLALVTEVVRRLGGQITIGHSELGGAELAVVIPADDHDLLETRTARVPARKER